MKNKVMNSKGIIILICMFLCCMMCMGMLQLQEGVQEVEKTEDTLLGFLAFEYDGVGEYGNLYYETFEGEKRLIIDHILDKDIAYFILDEARNKVFFIDQNNNLYMIPIGRQAEKIATGMNRRYMIESESKRYLFCASNDELGIISYIIVDKDEGIAHEIRTELNDQHLNLAYMNSPAEVMFNEETLTFCYVDNENNVYCSTAYEKPTLVEEKVSGYVSDKNGIVLYASSEEEAYYTFLNGPMKGERLKAANITKFRIEKLGGQNIVLFIDQKDDSQGLYMQRSGEENAKVVDYVIEDFEYVSEESKIYYISDADRLMSLNVNKVEDSGIGKARELDTGVNQLSLTADNKLTLYYRQGKNEGVYLLSEDKITLLASHVNSEKVFDNCITYVGKDNKLYIKSINNDRDDAPIDKCLTSEGELMGGYSVTPQGKYVTYFEKKGDKTSLMRYTKDQEVQTLIANTDDYDIIKVNNQTYQHGLKYSRIVGYYYNEMFDVLIEMTKDKEMIIYSAKEEKGRTRFEATEEQVYLGNEIKLSPLNRIDFTIDFFKDTFWNDEVFLTSHSIFIDNYYGGGYCLNLGGNQLELIRLNEEEFRKQLAAQKGVDEEREFLRKQEAVLFTKWYIGYLGQEMPSQIKVVQEEDHYMVQTYAQIVDKDYPNQYKVDKQTGEVIPLQGKRAEATTEYKDTMKYLIDDGILWMVDKQGQKGRLFKVDALYWKNTTEFEQTSELLWQKGNNIYFAVRRYNILDEYNEDTLYRYDLIQRKIVKLIEVESAFNRGVVYILETERGSICVEYCGGLHDLSRMRIDAISGEPQEWIAQAPRVVEEKRDIKDSPFQYEIIRPKDKEDYYICEFNKETRKQRLLCKIDTIDYYGGIKPDSAVKVGDEIYFMDYTYYLMPDELEQAVGCAEKPFVYCKVNVKTAEVSRVKEKDYRLKVGGID